MRSEEEIRQLLVLRTKEFNDYQVLKMRGDVTERLLRDLNWVLNDKGEK